VVDELLIAYCPEFFWFNLIGFVGFISFAFLTVTARRPTAQPEKETWVDTRHCRAA
jgi:hypothetical protein